MITIDRASRIGAIGQRGGDISIKIMDIWELKVKITACFDQYS